MTKYINPYTDFGFKKLFGEEASKDLLTDFLNELLPDQHQIASLSFQNPENQSKTETERKAIFDIYCKTSDGHAFIVEMQKAKMKFFKDRTLFYTSFPIQSQAQKGDWDFELKPIYCVAILDFEFDKKKEDFLSRVNLKDQYCDMFYDKLHFIFIEMPRFKKTVNELGSHFEKWLFFLKNLTTFDAIPDILKEPIFEKGLQIAEIAHYSPKEYEEYQKSLLTYFELKAVVDTSVEDGFIKGEKIGIEKGEKIGIEKGEKGKAEKTALIMHKEGESLEKIARYTGLTIDEIKRIIE